MRYIIGIDLGTTNCCVSYVDTANSNLAIQPFPVPQLVAAGQMQTQATLPSFCYLATPQEWPPKALNLPWKSQEQVVIGVFAQEQGAKVPTRLVQSAKSWLCHPAANRRDKILPLECSDAQLRISPVEATAHYLRHIKEAWNFVIARGNPELEFEEQEIILTVPASFDEVARTLTAEAAKLAGFAKMTLLEEPQAAFYSWISQHENVCMEQLPQGACVLVCDVGGGTTDFSLMEVSEKEGKRTIERRAVGEHLLIGGDNMDAALAHFLEQKLKNQDARIELNATQWLQLRHAARAAKEKLLAHSCGADLHVNILIQGAGSNVIKGSVSTSLTLEELRKLLLEGFFGQYSWEEALQLRKTEGLRTMGLPYESDPSITKHLANFLKQSLKQPDYVLFNGGSMKALPFQKAILEALKQWFPEKNIATLPSINLDLAVARGAAYYGKARRGLGVRIGGGAARGYYLAIAVKDACGETSQKALTLLPRGSEEDSSYESDQTFWLMPNTPVIFNLYSSHVRLDDKSGDLIDIEAEELQALPPLQTVLRFGKKSATIPSEKIPVHLQIGLTAIGILELRLKSQNTEHHWALQFQLKSSSGQDNSLAALEKERLDETFDANYLEAARKLLFQAFADKAALKPEQIMESLEKILESPRREWPLSILRGLWQPLLEQSERRKISLEHEVRWWNLAGFFLRPGFGYPLDDFRIKELWKIMLNDAKSVKTGEYQIQSWICTRRIAGGLNKGQQTQLANELIPTILHKKGKIELKGKQDNYLYSEKIRTLASMELIEISLKIKLGNAILENLVKGDNLKANFWALGRLGARHLLYGSAFNVVPPGICEKWIEALLKIAKDAQKDSPEIVFVIGQLARKVDQRELNLSENCVQTILDSFAESSLKERLKELLQKEVILTEQEQDQLFGEKLPSGLSLDMRN